MSTSYAPASPRPATRRATMRAAVFVTPGRIELQERPIPEIGPTDALLRVTTTTICGTDVHILKGEYPVAPGRVVGHEPVGVIEALGSAVTGYQVGQRVVAGAITPCGQCYACLGGSSAQCGGRALGGWRMGNTIDGCQADYVRIPDATANLAPIPDDLTDEQVLMCPDIMSTGFGGAESGQVRIGDVVAVFAQGPIGLCATAGARLRGASRIITVDSVPARIAISKHLGAEMVIDFTKRDPVAAIMELTDGRGVDAVIDCAGGPLLGASIECLAVGGTLVSLGAHAGSHEEIDLWRLILRSCSLVGSARGTATEIRRVVELAAAGALAPAIAGSFPLAEAGAAHAALESRDVYGKLVLVP